MIDTAGNQPEDDTSVARSYPLRDRLVIEPAGFLTLGSVKGLLDELRLAAEADVRLITIDLRHVSFMDSRGLDILVETSRGLRSDETPRAPRVVVTAGGQPERVLRLGMFNKILEITHDLEGEPAW